MKLKFARCDDRGFKRNKAIVAKHESEATRRERILRIRQYANEEPDSAEAKKLHAMADQLAQDNLPLPNPKPPKRQRNLFDPDKLD